MRFFAALVTASLVYGSLLGAQQTPPTRFDVASVKRSRPANDGVSTLTVVPGGVRVINLPLSTILWMAHGVQQDQVVNVPSWAASENFDITAKVPAGAPLNMDTFRPMLVDLLGERFELKTHHEMRELPMYRLVRVRPDRLGPRLAAAEMDCTGRAAPAANSSRAAVLRNCGAGPTPTGFRVHGMPLLVLARIMGPTAGRVIVDETGLSGNWDLDLDFTPAQLQPGPNDPPSLFAALQEQLGLKLEPGRAEVDVVVVDHLARPTED